MSMYRQFLPYGVAIGSMGIAVILSLWVQLVLPQTIGAFFYVAIAITAWYGGVRPAIVAIVLAVLALDYYFMPPIYQIWLSNLDDMLWLALFVGVSLIITLLSSNLRQSRKEIEQLSRKLADESADRLKTALNAAQMGMWDWNIVTGEVNWSPEHEQLFGLLPGSFDGTYETFNACLHPDDREGVSQAIAHSLQNQVPYHHAFRVVWVDGSVHWVEGRGHVFSNQDGKPVRMSGTIMAIDERQQAETALQERESLLRLFAQYAPAGIAMLDREMRYIMASQQWVDEHNLESVEALIGRSHYEIFPEVSERWRQIHQRCLAGAIEKCDEDVFVRADGRQQWLSWEIRPWHRATGEIGGIIIFAVDITNRKRAEIALQQLNTELERRVAERTAELKMVNDRLLIVLIEQQRAKQNVEDLYNNAPCGYHSLNAEGTIVRINDTELNWLGYTRDEVINKMKFVDLITPDSQKTFHQNFPRFMQQGWINNLEFQLRHKDGSTRWINLSSTAVKDDANNFVMSRTTLFDISERKQVEQRLALQAVITRNMAEGICLVRADDATIVYANPKFEQMFGYDPGELNGQHVSIVNYATESVTAEDVNQSIRAAVLQNSEATYEVHNVKKDGTPFWCSATCSVFNHPEYGDVLVAVHQDITVAKHLEEVRQQTEAVLRETERRWRSLLDNVQLIVVGLDQFGNVSYVNPFFLKLTGYTNSEVLGKNWVDHFLPPSSQKPGQTVFSEGVACSAYPHYQNSILTKSGEERYIAWNNTVLQGFDGNIIGTISIGEDVTERQKLEEIKNEFIGIVSHELRTPLTAIQMSLGLLKTGIYAKKPEKSQRMIEIALLDTNRLVNLVNDILDLERLESGRAVLEKTVCQAIDLMQQARDGVQAIATQQNITLTITPTDATVLVAPDMIIQTLTNLLGNAIKFSPAHSEINLRADYQSDHVLFQVTDQGRGIPDDKLEAIFGRFQQVDASDSREKGGTGLGLSICRSIIERHGGKIWAESTLGKGSTFFFTLPLPPESNP